MAYASEIWNESSRKLSIDVRGGAVESINDSFGEGLAVRTIEDGRLGFAYSTRAGEVESDVVAMAREGAKKLEQDEHEFPREEDTNGPFVDPARFSKLSQEQKIEMAMELEAGARGLDKRIVGVRKASYVEIVSSVSIKNSCGLSSSASRGLCYLSITAIAKDEPDSEWAGEIEFRIDPTDLDPRAVGESAAKKALAMLGGRKIASQSGACVLDRDVSGELLELLCQSFFADQIVKKKSVLGDKLGKEIYSKEISIVDDATMPSSVSAVSFDGEGVKTRRNEVVSRGIFNACLADTFWGKKLGVSSNGSSVRSGLMLPPKVGAHNIFIEAGSVGLKDMMKEMGRGFYITDLMGLHTANAITGEFSLGASGFWVENGIIVHPVKGVTVAGNLHDVLKRTVRVANDIKFWAGGGAPSLLIESLHISGS